MSKVAEAPAVYDMATVLPFPQTKKEELLEFARTRGWDELRLAVFEWVTNKVYIKGEPEPLSFMLAELVDAVKDAPHAKGYAESEFVDLNIYRVILQLKEYKRFPDPKDNFFASTYIVNENTDQWGA